MKRSPYIFLFLSIFISFFAYNAYATCHNDCLLIQNEACEEQHYNDAQGLHQRRNSANEYCDWYCTEGGGSNSESNDGSGGDNGEDSEEDSGADPI